MNRSPSDPASGSEVRNTSMVLADEGRCPACTLPVTKVLTDETGAWGGANCGRCGAHLSRAILAAIIAGRGMAR